MISISLSECGSNLFKCKNNHCVKVSNTCDGKDDCGDNSDEIFPCQGCYYDFSLIISNSPTKLRSK